MMTPNAVTTEQLWVRTYILAREEEGERKGWVYVERSSRRRRRRKGWTDA